MDNEAKIRQLEEELEISKAEGRSAAEIGMKLLQANEDIREQIQKDSKVYEEQIEELQQDAHSLKLKLQIHSKTNEAFEDEFRIMKSDMESSCNEKISLLQQNHTAKVTQLNLHVEELQSELTLREEQLERSRNVISQKDEEICRLRESVTNQFNDSSLLGECSELHQSLVRLEKQCHILQEEIERQSAATTEANEEKDILHSRINELEQVLKDKERLGYEWYQSLKESQEELVLLRGKLDHERVKHLQDDWQGQGNSLFGEVEDRRLQTERDLITMKVKYQSLERTHHTLLQSYKKLKAEFTALLCRHTSVTADADHVKRLQRTLSQRNSELEELNEKLNKMEKKRDSSSGSSGYANAFIEFGDKKEYIQYLEYEQKETQDKLCSLKRELDLKSTQLIWECKKLSESEAKLHKTERDKARMMNDACKIKLRLQETLEKQENGKDCVKNLQKEIEILKQQLQGKIKSGETFTTAMGRHESQEAKAMKKDKEDFVKKERSEEEKKNRKQNITINLLEELQKANDSNDACGNPSVSSSIEMSKDDSTRTAKVVAASVNNEEGKISVSKRLESNESLCNDKENDDHCKIESEKTVKAKPVVHKTIKAADSKAKMEQQCRQQ